MDGKRLGWLVYSNTYGNTLMNKEERIKYKVFSIRLHEETKKKFIGERKKSGLSWNRFLLTLLDKNYRKKLKV